MPPEKRSLLFFLEGRDVPASRFRVEQYEPFLKEQGVKYRFLYTKPGKYLYYPGWVRLGKLRYPWAALLLAIITVQRLVQILLYVPQYDVIVLQRDLLYRVPIPFLEGLIFLLARIRRTRARVVLDVDDAIYLTKGGNSSPATAAKIKFIATNCDLVLAGNNFLREYFARHVETVVIPTTIDVRRFSASMRAYSKDQPIIGWTGTSANFHYLCMLRSALQRLSAERAFRLLIIAESGSKNPLPELANVEMLPWSRESELSDIAQFDIGLMPLLDSEWARGKCGFKLIQYLALGIPAVCSPLGANPEIITDSVTGFFAATEDEWVRILALLCEDAKLRERVGAAGRRRAEEGFSHQAWFGSWLRAIVGAQDL